MSIKKIKYQLSCIVLSMLLVNCTTPPIEKKGKPNVIIIYTDDQGAVDLGSYGATDIYSPNIDKLAANGTRFTQSYVAAPVCVPSRVALLTGKYPQNAGVTGNTSAKPGSHGLRAEQYTLAELFRDNGYATGHVGKWHLGMSEESSPNAQGFDYSFGHLRGCIDNYSHFFYWEGPNIHDLHENGKEVFYDGQYFPDLASDKAIQYVENQKDNPFFMYYAINMPHYPYQPTDKWREHYKDMPKPRADYAAFISTIDERIGFLIDKLEELDILDNTIIIYQSDNGYSTEVRAFNGGGDSGPYRGAKSSLFEGGIRLPTIISWADQLPKNEVNDEFIMNLDWMPTLISLCDLSPTEEKIDGIDMSTMIQHPGTTSPRTAAFWKYGAQWVVRKGKWKLIGYPKDTSHKGELNFENDALFLSNLDEDVSEMNNLASKYPEIVEELIQEYLNWEHGNQADVPKKVAKTDHKGLNKQIIASIKPHGRYKNIDVLLDGTRGYADFSSGQWIGKEGTAMEYIIDLESAQQLTTLEIGYLHAPGNWIFAPKSATVSFSNDGKSFSNEITKETGADFSKKINDLNSFTMNIEQKSRFIKVKINGIGSCPEGHAGAGNPAWAFIDEIIIN